LRIWTAARLLDIRSADLIVIELALECSSSGTHAPCGVSVGELRLVIRLFAATAKPGTRRRQRRARPARQHHWALMFAVLITCPHLSISEFRNDASSSGVEPMTTTPLCSSLSLTAGSARAATVSV